MLTNLRQAVKEKRSGMLTRGPLLLHDNASAHMARVAQAVSQGHRVWAAVSPTLITRPGTQRLLPISTSEAAPSRNEVFRQWWTVTGYGVISRQHAPGILFDWNKRTFWQMWKVYWCTSTLKNYVIISSVPFVYHTELQNFLIVPRTYAGLLVTYLQKLMVDILYALGICW